MAHDSDINAVEFCPTEDKLATVSDDGTLKVWEVIQQAEVAAAAQDVQMEDN